MKNLVVAALSWPAVQPCLAEGVPTVATIQEAYDGARLEEPGRHDDQLQIRTADCRPLNEGQFTCQVGFTDRRSSNDRLYFDVIGLGRDGSRWTLVSGLCRR